VLRHGRLVRLRGRALRGVHGRRPRPAVPGPRGGGRRYRRGRHGTSCREQILHGTQRQAWHPVELVEQARTSVRDHPGPARG
jgi:hypothetical protein